MPSEETVVDLSHLLPTAWLAAQDETLHTTDSFVPFSLLSQEEDSPINQLIIETRKSAFESGEHIVAKVGEFQIAHDAAVQQCRLFDDKFDTSATLGRLRRTTWSRNLPR